MDILERRADLLAISVCEAEGFQGAFNPHPPLKNAGIVQKIVRKPGLQNSNQLLTSAFNPDRRHPFPAISSPN